MANPGHVAHLKQGPGVWNGWLALNRDTKPDLRHSDLRCVRLIEVSPHGGSGFALYAANLAGVDLEGADLSGADLTLVDLSKANLRDAILDHAVLTHSVLRSADLTRAQFGNTVFADTDLSRATGLATCHHYGPSILDHRTLAKSGKLPREFLRSCGLPDFITENTRLLRSDFYACFISCSGKDQEFTERLHADLQEKGVRCWLAAEDLPIGARTRPKIDETIYDYDKVLVVLSEHSIASQWVEQEVETALARERKTNETILCPIRIDDAIEDIASGWASLVKNTRNIGDFTRWKDHDAYQNAFERLLRDLRAETTTKSTP